MRYGLLLLLYSWSLGAAQAQLASSDSTLLITAAQQAIARYEQVSNSNELLYNGIEHIGYDTHLKGHPFFASDSMQTGVVHYAGKTFSLPLLYDIVRDVLVVSHTSGYRLALQSNRIESFTLMGHTYAWLTDSSNRDMRPGFYDLLYQGPTQLLARRTKTVIISPSANGGYGVFDAITIFYIRKGNRYEPVKNKKMLLNVLSDKKKQLVAYARKQKLTFRPDPEAAILKLTQQYDELNKAL